MRGISILILVVSVLLAACAPKIALFPDATDPLMEFVLEGQGPDKVLMIAARGLISSEPDSGMLRTRPSMVQEVVAQLKKAENDDSIKAIVLQIDSPGGTATGSDILYHELLGFKERTGRPMVAAMMNVAASGGYYIALPADHILAHPTTVTGSVGAIFMLPRVTGLMDKVGVQVDVAKSGRNKDMASPFRDLTDEEREIMQGLIDDMAGRFLSLTDKHRTLTPDVRELTATARVFTATEAENMGLIDQVGYLEDAFDKARELAELPEDAPVVVYRRSEYADDNPYNTMAHADPAKPQVIGLDADWLAPRTGLHYLWLPGR